MSRGYFDYRNQTLADDMFGWNCGDYPHNIFQDREMTAIAKDVFDVIYALDSYLCGDWGEESYREAVDKFKKKWLKSSRKSILKDMVDKSINELRTELYAMIGTDKPDNAEIDDGK